MNYVAFEAGSRAGLSTEIFFRAWRCQLGLSANECGEDILILVDSDKDTCNISGQSTNVVRVSEMYASALIERDENVVVFPADELTRQLNDAVREKASHNRFSFVDPLWYDKAHVNNVLSELVNAEECNVLIPLTFGLSDEVIIKPCKASAGSKGIESFKDVCVSQKIDIAREYVVDVLRSDTEIDVYPREVRLRAGYDKLIKLLDPNGKFADEVRKFIELVSEKFPLFAPGIFHIQLAEDVDGTLYYIESSRRISGTSLVNLVNGFNPFCFMNGSKGKVVSHKFEYGKWYRYEDFVLEVESLIKKMK